MPEKYMITTSFTLDLDTIERLKAMATTEDRSQSSLIRRLINQEFEFRALIQEKPMDNLIPQSPK